MESMRLQKPEKGDFMDKYIEGYKEAYSINTDGVYAHCMWREGR